MPILTRFLPAESALVDMALAFADPARRPRARLYRRIRRGAFYGVQLVTGWTGGNAAAVFARLLHHRVVTFGMWLYVPVFLLCALILIEMFHVERSYRRFGL